MTVNTVEGFTTSSALITVSAAVIKKIWFRLCAVPIHEEAMHVFVVPKTRSVLLSPVPGRVDYFISFPRPR